MPRKENEDVSEGEGPILLQLLSGGITLENFHRMWSEKIDKTFDKYIGIIRIIYEESSRSTEVGPDSGVDDGGTDQREVCQEQEDRQPRRHGDRRASKYEDSRAHGGRRYCSTSDAWG